jgi:hypothetical protein
MRADVHRFGLNPLFLRCLVALAVLSAFLVLVHRFWPQSVLLAALVLLVGGALVSGVIWYAIVGWAWRLGRINAQHIRQPATLVMTAWLLCVATAMLSGRPEQAHPSPVAPSASKIFQGGPFRYLSDLPVYAEQAGRWPITRNGLIGDGGKVIIVNGDSSPKGIGMHPPDNADAVVKFRLYREAAWFKAKAGLNDTAGRIVSSAVFEVLGDGKPLWKSDPLDRAGRSRDCIVDVSDVDVLELRVHATGPGQELHAAWMEPRVLQAVDTPDQPPPVRLFESGPREFLSDLPEFDVKPGPVPFVKNGDFGAGIEAEKRRIKVNGVLAPHGLGMHPPARGYAGVKYRLNKQAAVFRATTALNDGCSFTIGSCHFEVNCDGVSRWESKTITKDKQVEDCRIPVTGVDILELRVVDNDIVNTGLWAVWSEPRVLRTADAPDD